MLGYDVEIFETNGEKTISTSYPNIYILLVNDITTADNCTPYLIAAYNSHLEIKAGRIVSLIP